MNRKTSKKCISNNTSNCRKHMVHSLLLTLMLLSCLFDEISAITEYAETHNKVQHEQTIDDGGPSYITGRLSFLMPNVKPYAPNTTNLYLCTSIRIDDTTNFYIQGYEPNATMHTVHHLNLYGCGEPGTTKPVWNCGGMEIKPTKEGDIATPCAQQSTDSQILYVWAFGAPKLALPDGVGFKVGKNSPIKYMVLQVHYGSVANFADGRTDNSGVFIDYTTKPLNKLAAVFLLGTIGYIPPMTTEHMEVCCEMNEQKTIYPIAYSTHTHSLGKVVAGYRVRSSNDSSAQEWTQLGKNDPKKAQIFYPIENSEPILAGDRLAVRCTIVSNRTWTTEVGITIDDEMCNFYLMYYVNNEEPLKMKYCFSQGPPNYYWTNPDVGLNNIPDFEASHL